MSKKLDKPGVFLEISRLSNTLAVAKLLALIEAKNVQIL